MREPVRLNGRMPSGADERHMYLTYASTGGQLFVQAVLTSVMGRCRWPVDFILSGRSLSPVAGQARYYPRFSTPSTQYPTLESSVCDTSPRGGSPAVQVLGVSSGSGVHGSAWHGRSTIRLGGAGGLCPPLQRPVALARRSKVHGSPHGDGNGIVDGVIAPLVIVAWFSHCISIHICSTGRAGISLPGESWRSIPGESRFRSSPVA